ncbi:bile acid:sodium symporter [Robertmurraya korlensis]|uniref:bile acid:sodium symporter family protein n=1 Tax=Robertmurraya korlensis TaxID=519977 RepID=UPI00203B12E7|nr:bile acid:sodium symporter [Robertmurraya korlensis]MCM3601234.1 bile acid:sodium symporter [Robertmurraya korlensis]
MVKVTEFLSKRLPLLIIITGISTYFSPVYLKVPPIVPSALLGIVILFTGLSMNIEGIKTINKKKTELFIIAILKWTITVLISIGLASLFFSDEPEVAAGLILAGAVPSATAATVYTFIAGGNTSLVIASSLLDVIISPFVTPLSMMGISNSNISISSFNLLQSFILIVIVPLSAGLFFQQKAKRLVENSKMITKLGSALALLLIVHIIMVSGKESIASELELIPLVVVSTFVQVLLPMVLTYFICKKIMNEEDTRAAIFQVGLCNTAFAAILAYQFIGELGVIAPILNMMVNLSIGALLANYFSKEEIKSSAKPIHKIPV